VGEKKGSLNFVTKNTYTPCGWPLKDFAMQKKEKKGKEAKRHKEDEMGGTAAACAASEMKKKGHYENKKTAKTPN